MDELLIMAFIRMLGEKALNIKRLPNGYCGDHEGSNCEICRMRPWWEIDFEYVGPIVIGWRKRVINIDWEKTGRKLDPEQITKTNTTSDETMIHAWGYADALTYMETILSLLRIQRRDEERAAK